jgi:hypothetical protein
MNEQRVTPREVEVRAATARDALGSDSIEWRGSNTSTITATTAEVLSVDALPLEQSGMVSVFEAWRALLGVDAEVHLIERSRLDSSSDVVSVIRSRLGVGAASYERDVVAAVRSVGWTIMAIDRIDLDQNGERQRWVDLRATDVVGQVHRDST